MSFSLVTPLFHATLFFLFKRREKKHFFSESAKKRKREREKILSFSQVKSRGDTLIILLSLKWTTAGVSVPSEYEVAVHAAMYVMKNPETKNAM